jgi:nucleoid-associated protein YgaU
VTTRRSRAGRRLYGWQVVAALVAVAGVLILLVGPPLLVLAAYGPGGYRLPVVRTDLSRRLSDSDVIALLAVAVLVTWLRWVACLSLEAAAALRHRGLPRPLPLLTGLEHVAARRLVTAALGLLVGAGPVAPAAALAAPTAAVVQPARVSPDATAAAAHHVDGAAHPAASPANDRPAVGASAHSGLKRYVVQASHNGRFDSLWSIADRYLGDGLRYPEIYSLNKDRVQPDGRRLQLAQLIRPGWVLLLPADATGLPAWTADPPPARPLEVTVVAGDTLSGIAARWLGEPNRYHEIFALNAGRVQPDGSRLTDPDRILPGLHLRLPANQPTTRQHSPAPPTSGQPTPPPDEPGLPATPPRPTEPAPPTTPPHSTPPQRAPEPRPSPAQPVARPRHSNAPAWVTGGVLLTTSVAGLTAYRRRRRDAKVRPGQAVPQPTPELVGLHTAVRADEDNTSIDRVDGALRTLAAVHTGQSDPRRRPVPQVLLHHADGTIDVFLRDPIDPPAASWTTTTSGQIWTLPRDAPTGKSDGPPPCPALVQLGTTDDDSNLYADLEALGVLGIDATGADLRAIARAITATLTLSQHAELVRVRALGFDPYGLAREERLTAADSLDDLLDHLTADTTPATTALARTRLGTTFALRATDGDDNWAPTVAVIAGQPLDQAAADQLTDLAQGSRGAAIITAAGGALPTRWRLTLQPPADTSRPATAGARWRLDPLGIPLTPLSMAAEELADLTALLADVAAPPQEIAAGQAQPQADNRPVEPPETTSADDPSAGDATAEAPSSARRNGEPATIPIRHADEGTLPAGPDWTVMVRLIGPVDIVARDGRTLDRPAPERTLEVLAWLVTHRTGATRLDLEAAIWANGVRAGTVMNQLSRARQILDQLAGPAAHTWIPSKQTTIDRAVISDLDLLRAYLAAADRHANQPDRAMQALQASVDLIRGIPARYPWLDAEIGSTLTILPATAAARLAELHLQRGDRAGVLDATARGLRILPAHTELFALRMRAAATVGDSAAVKAEYDAYRRAEQADPFYDGDTDRDLQRLYQELLHPRRRAALG